MLGTPCSLRSAPSSTHHATECASRWHVRKTPPAGPEHSRPELKTHKPTPAHISRRAPHPRCFAPARALLRLAWALALSGAALHASAAFGPRTCATRHRLNYFPGTPPLYSQTTQTTQLLAAGTLPEYTQSTHNRSRSTSNSDKHHHGLGISLCLAPAAPTLAITTDHKRNGCHHASRSPAEPAHLAPQGHPNLASRALALTDPSLLFGPTAHGPTPPGAH